MAEKKVACDCGWSFQSASDDEIFAQVKEHAKSAHNMEVTRESALAMAKPVS